MCDRGPLRVIGAIEEDEEDEDNEREKVAFNPLDVGKLSFSLEEKGGRWVFKTHALVAVVMVLT